MGSWETPFIFQSCLGPDYPSPGPCLTCPCREPAWWLIPTQVYLHNRGLSRSKNRSSVPGRGS
jgi:hypothetical protein